MQWTTDLHYINSYHWIKVRCTLLHHTSWGAVMLDVSVHNRTCLSFHSVTLCWLLVLASVQYNCKSMTSSIWTISPYNQQLPPPCGRDIMDLPNHDAPSTLAFWLFRYPPSSLHTTGISFCSPPSVGCPSACPSDNEEDSCHVESAARHVSP